MSSRRKVWKCCAIFFATLTCTGCFDQVEVDNLNTVVGLGIDQLDNKNVEVTVEIVNSTSQSASPDDKKKSGGKTESQTFVYSSKAKSIPEALDKYLSKLSKVLYLPHNSIVVFGQTYAQHGIDDAFDYLERSRYYRRNQLWVVTHTSARQLLESNAQTQPINALAMRNLVEQMAKSSKLYETDQLRVMRQYLSVSNSPVVSCVDIDETGNPYLAGLGVFRHAKLAAVLPMDESQSLTWLLCNSKQMVLTIPTAKRDEVKNTASIRILRMNRRVHCRIEHGEPVFEVAIQGKAEIEHLPEQTQLTPQFMKLLQSNVDKKIVADMKNTVDHLQKIDCDATQFGNVLFRTNPNVWRNLADNWQETFPHLKVSYTADIDLLGNGLTSTPPVSTYSPKGISPGLQNKE
ncbi:Ger(x)C family spore germination protein [Alicyclobacillus fodiniaquatilis]|jgi:Ger(x)C family germination protein|uniref:Ger(X)C family spore germination protein n=1 Tax=Alicyclobacillus fodiniaquatilis TaxID=1661150 RepID=A0ABW4JQN2_9BACL